METIETDIEKAAGAIIDNEGIKALTVDALTRQMRISKAKLLTYFRRDEDILKFMALRFEDNIQQLINNIEANYHEPEKGLSDLFKELFNFYNQKRYFLELLFADLTNYENNAVPAILLRIRKMVEKQLTQIIEQGKKTGVFNSGVNTTQEVASILNRFRFFMSDVPVTHKMIRDLKELRENRE